MTSLSSTIVEIPISQLVPSPRNVRKSKPSKQSHQELVAGIRAIGVLHPPTVTAGKDGTFEVIAGKRRLRALQDLVKEGHFEADQLVACRKVNGEVACLEEISLIENTQREEMHPADEFEAFRKMQRSGSSVQDIALHLGIPEHKVYQRLKLGQVAQAIIKAYRNGELDLSTVMAFTIEDDKTRQVEVFEKLRETGRIWARSVREELKNESVVSTSRLGTFVGRKTYEKAGGSVSQDLFEDTVYLNDVDLLKQLATAKLERVADRLSADWSWIEITLDETRHAHNTLAAYDTEETGPLLEQLKAIEDEIDTLHDTEDEDWSEEIEDQIERLATRADEAREAVKQSRTYRPEEMQFAGCIVSIDYRGKLLMELGLVRKQDQGKLAAFLKKAAAGKSTDSANKDRTAPGAPATPAGESHEYSQALLSDLITYRLNIAKRHLAEDTAAAQNLLIYTLCNTCFNTFYYSSALELNMSETNPESQLTRPDTGNSFASLKARHDSLPFDWLSIEDEAERYQAFSAIDIAQKLDLMAYCVASALRANRLNGHVNTVAEIVIRGLDIPWHREFQPTVDNYFDRLSKKHLIEHGRMFLEEEWADRAAKRPKKEIAEDLEAVFAGKDMTMPTEARAAAMDWVPAGFDHAED